MIHFSTVKFMRFGDMLVNPKSTKDEHARHQKSQKTHRKNPRAGVCQGVVSVGLVAGIRGGVSDQSAVRLATRRI